MAIRIEFRALQGAGKTHLMKEIAAFLKERGYGGSFHCSDGVEDQWNGHQPQHVIMVEVQGDNTDLTADILNNAFNASQNEVGDGVPLESAAHPEPNHLFDDVLKQPQDIGWAVKQMYNGSTVRRAGWNGKGMWLALQAPDAKSKMSLPYVYMSTAQGHLVPWLCNQTDLLAVDWEIAT